MARNRSDQDFSGAVADSIANWQERHPNKAERREAYYVAEIKKAEARKARDKHAFDFWVAEARRRRDEIGD